MVFTYRRKILSFLKTKRDGVFRNTKTGKYLARITIKGKQKKCTFDKEYDAILWRSAMEDGEPAPIIAGNTSTLKYVWHMMQEKHFPLIAESTKEIWLRRYQLLKDLEEFQMSELTHPKITSWVEQKVAYFKSDDYLNTGRGQAKRCNLDNELNLLTTIFNWYKSSEDFATEAISLENPVKQKHKKMGFVRAKPVKDKAITLEAALQFFDHLKPLYRDLANFQFYTASRISEVAGLQWSRVDFKNRRITIMETCRWDMTTKMFIELNKTPKNKEPRPVFMTAELEEILKRRLPFKCDDSDFVFHVDGKPLNYGTIQLNFREGQRKSKVPYTGTHILRHGMAKLARQVGGGLDAVIAMTGHKDLKLADHYSKLDLEFQKEISEKIMNKVRKEKAPQADNVISILQRFKA
jgi:integrase